jgi:hypothetical protein
MMNSPVGDGARKPLRECSNIPAGAIALPGISKAPPAGAVALPGMAKPPAILTTGDNEDSKDSDPYTLSHQNMNRPMIENPRRAPQQSVFRGTKAELVAKLKHDKAVLRAQRAGPAQKAVTTEITEATAVLESPLPLPALGEEATEKVEVLAHHLSEPESPSEPEAVQEVANEPVSAPAAAPVSDIMASLRARLKHVKNTTAPMKARAPASVAAVVTRETDTKNEAVEQKQSNE